jgi:tRNA(Met) cytidine acetyltransferase
MIIGGQAGSGSREESILLKISKSMIREVMRENYIFFRKKYKAILKIIAATRHRTLIVVTGADPVKQGLVTTDLVRIYASRRKDRVRVLYVHHNEFAEELIRVRIFRELLPKLAKNVDIEVIRYEDTEEYLGTTYSTLIMDLTDSLKPNDVGRLVGIVEGGGVIIFITPPLDKWPQWRNLFREELAVPQKPVPRTVFVRWFIDNLLRGDGVSIYDPDGDKILKIAEHPKKSPERERIVIPEDVKFPKEVYQKAVTMDQVRVIRELERLIEKPRRRTSIVVISDRGRGKSSAIGIGIIGLIGELLKVKNRVRVGVTARSLLSVEQLMKMAIETLEAIKIPYKVIKRGGRIIEVKGERFSIEYWEPSTIPKLDLDVAIVDEAAGLPVNILWKIWESVDRSIFATTIHGYEGAGRGFTVRFLKRVKSDEKSSTYIVEMNEPIRYASGDPVEAWQFRTLLLDAEPEKLDESDLEAIARGNLIYLKLEPEELFTDKGKDMLKSLFGIYVQAHYRNEPDDLGMIADAPHHSVRAMATPSGKIVGSAQLAEEGPVVSELQLILGAGKMPGNIIPDRIIKHYRVVDFARTVGWRIVRIAVHPEVQGRGIGSSFLRKIEEEAIERGYSWVGSGFGATEELLNFWLKNGYMPIHMSPERNPVSGEYTCIVVKPLSDSVKSLIEAVGERFRHRVLESMYDTYRDLEPEVARLLLKPLSCGLRVHVTSYGLDKVDLERILLYVRGIMTYEVCNDAVKELIMGYWRDGCLDAGLEKKEELLTIVKVLQGSPWNQVEKILRMGEKVAIDAMRGIVKKVLVSIGIDINREIEGVTLEDLKNISGKS